MFASRKMTYLFAPLALAGMALMTGCSSTTKTCASGCGCEMTSKSTGTSIAPRVELPTTPTEQSKATPDEVLNQLMDGNARYVAGERTPIDIRTSRAEKTKGQWPVAYILSCVDSRVPVEIVFDQGIGDIFVGRVAGNIENEDQLGSMEFAAKAAGVKLVMVLGHTACGAVKGACDDVKLGNLTALLSKIRPAVDAVEGHDGARTSKNAAFVNEVVRRNVVITVHDIRKRSPVLAELEREGRIMIVGAVYALATGEVTLLDADGRPMAYRAANPGPTASTARKDNHNL